MVSAGSSRCEFINVESEFAAMSVAIGASATGARAYTATASQGLLFMAEAVYNAAGLGLPIVMTVANRAIGAPINIWNDHSDAMSQRDAGWIQLYAETTRRRSTCTSRRSAWPKSSRAGHGVHGRLRAHPRLRAGRRARPGRGRRVRAALRPRQLLDPDEPVTIGAMVGPEAFTEVRYLAYQRQRRRSAHPGDRRRVPGAFGRASGGLLRPYRCEGAETVVVALGSVLGTFEDAVDGLRDDGVAVGVVGLTISGRSRARPSRRARRGQRGVDRARAGSRSAPAGSSRRTSQRHSPGRRPRRSTTVIAGLGGRAGDPRRRCADDRPTRSPGGSSRWSSSTSTGNWSNASCAGTGHPRSGPAAENILRDVGIVAHGRTIDATWQPGIRTTRSAASPSATGCWTATSARSRPMPTEPTRSPAGTGPARAAARRSARATRRRGLAGDRRPAGGSQRDRLPGGVLDPLSGDRVADAVAALAVRQRTAVATGVAAALRAPGTTTSGCSPREATAAPSTSASAACRACSSATTTCCMSVTTTRAT